ncbi:peroxidase-related enzyme [Ornithinimicrobium tianjinense]|uniref:Alkyl hydroperoxide reductase AhpD n=1 Tax=Ornithinimicrobium tianjinense TaxID=1195761 RepID=A0A917F549_9MICO|nr:peroxidase-related enzyme [Ornithinimicrobium tianjinense]GGF51170.1 alkyl hydroperoxide reductase AhpD [Ornithinimicrobium tianjinense]
MTQPQHDPTISALPLPARDDVPEGVRRLWDKSQEVFGFVPNVFVAQAYNGEQFQAWWAYFNLLVNKEGHLTNAERELLAVVVSGLNRCTYCAVSHGAALRHYSGDPVTADLVAVNWRQAQLPPREAALAAYAEQLTLRPAEVTALDLEPLRAVGLDDHQILEAIQVIGMFNMTNRVSTALAMVPNVEYHAQGRGA